jgi:hypothetical protein
MTEVAKMNAFKKFVGEKRKVEVQVVYSNITEPRSADKN